jgi:FtsZ-binding cell division protein ZapB
MSEFAWDSNVSVENNPQQPEEEAAPAQTLAVSADDFSSLEERVLRAVALLKQERSARAEAEARLREQAQSIEDLHKENTALRSERNEVRQRVERLLSQLDALEL